MNWPALIIAAAQIVVITIAYQAGAYFTGRRMLRELEARQKKPEAFDPVSSEYLKDGRKKPLM